MPLDPADMFYYDGTLTITHGSDQVVGYLTSWDTALLPRDFLVPNAGSDGLTVVLSVEDSTHLTLARPWDGPTLTGVPYLAIRWTDHTDPRNYGPRIATYLEKVRGVPDNVDEFVDTITAGIASATAAATSATASASAASASQTAAAASATGAASDRTAAQTAQTAAESARDAAAASATSAGAASNPGFLYGATMIPGGSANLLTLASGVARDATNTMAIAVPAWTKDLAATWAAGNGNGGFAAGESLPLAGTVHVWAIAKADGTADVMASNHASSGLSPALPTGYAYKRRLGSLRTASGSVIPFVQVEDEFYFSASVAADYSSASLASSPGTLVSLSVPIGISVRARYRAIMGHTSTLMVGKLSSPYEPDLAVNGTAGDGDMTSPAAGVYASADRTTRTNTSGQIRARSSVSGSSLFVTTYGWTDARGRLG